MSEADVTYTDTDVLFHYCGAESFKKILETKSLRLSEHTCLNDISERRHGIGLARNILDDELLRVVPAPNSPARQAKYRFIQQLDSLLEGSPKDDPHLICFSSEIDLLGQWREYADRSKGFAIGFRAAALTFGRKDSLLPVSYDHLQQKEFLKKTLGLSFDRIADNPSESTVKLELEISLDTILATSICFKNATFREEKEYRVVHGIANVFNDQPIEEAGLESGYFVRDGRFVRFVVRPFDSKWEENSVSEVVLGPLNPHASDSRMLRRFLDEHGYSHAAIRVSNLPLR